jgi:hypothetical protein
VGFKLPFILLSDGRKHPLAKPKKKNVRHVKALQSVATSLNTKLQRGELVSNEEVLQALLLLKPDNL